MQEGFSLVELLVFVTVLSVFFVVAASSTTTIMKYQQMNYHKVFASRYAEEALEWLRGVKEEDWVGFTNTYSDSGGSTYCFNSLPGSDAIGGVWSMNLADCDSVDNWINKTYKRIVTLTTQANNTVIADIYVYWYEGKTLLSTKLNVVFSVWE